VLEVEDAIPKDWQGGHGNVVHLIDQLFIQWLSSESSVETKIELWDHIQEVLIEVIEDKQRITSVSLTTMEKEQWF
jgi:phenylpyruvate tautomerase PptA (4-oxalocrotonate tautomerase family)